MTSNYYTSYDEINNTVDCVTFVRTCVKCTEKLFFTKDS